MKSLPLLLCTLLVGCVSNPINYSERIKTPEVPKQVYYSGKEMQVQFSFKIVAIVPPRERLDTYYEGNYKIVRCR